MIQSKQIELVPINRALRELRQLCVDTNEHTRQSKSVTKSIHSRATTHSPSKRDARDSKPRRRRSPSSSDAPIFSGHSCAIAGFVRKNFIYAQHTPVPRRTHSSVSSHHASPLPRASPREVRGGSSQFAIRQYHPSVPPSVLPARARTKSLKKSPSTISPRGPRVVSSLIAAVSRRMSPEYRSFFPLVHDA